MLVLALEFSRDGAARRRGRNSVTANRKSHRGKQPEQPPDQGTHGVIGPPAAMCRHRTAEKGHEELAKGSNS